MKKLLILAVIVLLTGTFSCKKKKNNPSGEKLFTFNSLVADKDTISSTGSTNLRASISGEGSYAWTASNGASLLGSGSTVFFAACCAGKHIFTCTVTDKNNNSETKTVSVYVE
jgi:hypothetical protein